jgi:plastocyanin
MRSETTSQLDVDGTAYQTADLLVLDRSWRPGEMRAMTLVDVVPAAAADEDTVERRETDGVARASSIRIGPVMVGLDNHVTIAYGLEAGLLQTIERGNCRLTISADALDLAGVTSTVTLAPPREGGDVQRVLYGWHLGMPLVHHVTLPEFYGGPLPAEPDPDVPVMRTYLTAPVDPAAPSSPVREVPTADGPRTMPSHQNTTDAHPGPEPRSAYGFFVVRGPKGSAETVRLADPVENSIPADPMASAIRIGGQWLGLNNHLVIEHGVELGLLALVPLEYGGQMRTAFPDGLQLSVETSGSTTISSPAIARTTAGTFDIKTHDMELVGNRTNTLVSENARRVDIVADDLRFTPARITAVPGENLNIVLHARDVMHNLELEGVEGYAFADAGQTTTAGLRAPDEPGEYPFACTLMSHRAAGMTGTLVVEP